MTFSSVKILSSFAPPSNSLVFVLVIGQLFKLTQGPSWALFLLHPEHQRYKDTVKGVALGAEVPGHHQKQLPQTLIMCK